MQAAAYHGKHDIRIDTVPDPKILNPRDAIIEVTLTAICGSDLHIYNGMIAGMEPGDVLGHEFMGRVVEVGRDSTLSVGQRVVVPFTISCGNCFYCQRSLFAACDNSNPMDTRGASETMFGHAMSGMFGYSHLTGGYAGGQAQYVRVPYSDVGPIVIPDDGFEDEDVLFLSDILPTGWMAAENARITPEDTVAVWGCGPVGLFAIQSAFVMGAAQVIAIDHVPGRLQLAQSLGAQVIDFRQTRVLEALMEMTGGLGPDAVIDAVGMESHGLAPDAVLDHMKQKIGLPVDNAHALREAIMACRKGGHVSVPGVYAGYADRFPLGMLMQKGLHLATGQTHVQRYMGQLLHRIAEGEIDTRFLISHRLGLNEVAEGYRNFCRQPDTWTKVVMRP